MHGNFQGDATTILPRNKVSLGIMKHPKTTIFRDDDWIMVVKNDPLIRPEKKYCKNNVALQGVGPLKDSLERTMVLTCHTDLKSGISHVRLADLPRICFLFGWMD